MRLLHSFSVRGLSLFDVDPALSPPFFGLSLVLLSLHEVASAGRGPTLSQFSFSSIAIWVIFFRQGFFLFFFVLEALLQVFDAWR